MRTAGVVVLGDVGMLGSSGIPVAAVAMTRVRGIGAGGDAEVQRVYEFVAGGVIDADLAGLAHWPAALKK